MDIRIFKPLRSATAVAELWDGDRLVAEVFARHDGCRRLYLSKEPMAWGLEWDPFIQLLPQITALLDEADEEMRQNRERWGAS